MSRLENELRRENNRLEKGLSAEANEVITDIVVYITRTVYKPRPAALIAVLLCIAAIAIAGLIFLGDTVIMTAHIAADLAVIAALLIIYAVIDSRV